MQEGKIRLQSLTHARREEDKRAYRDAHFQEDLDRAKELGRRLVQEAIG